MYLIYICICMCFTLIEIKCFHFFGKYSCRPRVKNRHLKNEIRFFYPVTKLFLDLLNYPSNFSKACINSLFLIPKLFLPRGANFFDPNLGPSFTADDICLGWGPGLFPQFLP